MMNTIFLFYLHLRKVTPWLFESLARLRPVIIFEEIKHVVGDKKGVFVSRRNPQSLLEKIQYIKNNYEKIQEDMKKNKLPLKQDFLKQFKTLISNR